MFDHVAELAHLITRWVHLIAGIMWVGNSMLFNWLDRNLERTKDDPLHVGEIWMVHSGGFYQVEKKHLEPAQMPKTLHWFMFQNLTTWVSGICLLILVYYMSAKTMMVDPLVAPITGQTAVAISAGSLLGAWLLYNALWRSPLGKSPGLASLLSLGVVVASAALYFNVYSGRAAYVHVGVLLGTMMTGNVWFVIVPSQRELVAATKEGRAQDPALGMQAKERSIHNNYMTFPLLFIMLSGHFPSTFSHPKNWLILTILALSSAGVRHLMNVRFTTPGWLWPASGLVVGAIAILLVLFSDLNVKSPSAGGPAPTFAEVQGVVERRCVRCHAQHPTDDVYKLPPNGFVLDSPDAIVRQADKIVERSVKLKNMPLANTTQMTDDERALLGAWHVAGAKGP
jgi:uncharacterized membrane protein